MLQNTKYPLFLTLIFSFPSFPAAAEVSWVLRAGGVWVDADGSLRQNPSGGDQVESDADPAFGLAVTAEVRTHERVGFEFGALAVTSQKLGVRVSSGSESFTVEDDLDLMIFGAGVNFHLTPGKKADVYLGPFIAYALFDDLGFLVPGEIAPVRFGIGNEFGFGAVLGVDVPIAERWIFNATARYLALGIDPIGPDGGADTLDLDPLALGLAIGYRF